MENYCDQFFNWMECRDEDVDGRAAAIVQSMDISLAFWGKNEEPEEKIPATRLKCPLDRPNKASESALRVWERMSQMDLDKIKHVDSVLMSDGEIGTEYLFLSLKDIIEGVGLPLDEILTAVDQDVMKALISLANEILYIYNQNEPPEILEEEEEFHSCFHVDSGLGTAKQKSTERRKREFSAKIKFLLKQAEEMGLGDISVPSSPFLSDRSRLALIERQVRGKMRMKNVRKAFKSLEQQNVNNARAKAYNRRRMLNDTSAKKDTKKCSEVCSSGVETRPAFKTAVKAQTFDYSPVLKHAPDLRKRMKRISEMRKKLGKKSFPAGNKCITEPVDELQEKDSVFPNYSEDQSVPLLYNIMKGGSSNYEVVKRLVETEMREEEINTDVTEESLGETTLEEGTSGNITESQEYHDCSQTSSEQESMPICLDTRNDNGSSPNEKELEQVCSRTKIEEEENDCSANEKKLKVVYPDTRNQKNDNDSYNEPEIKVVHQDTGTLDSSNREEMFQEMREIFRQVVHEVARSRPYSLQQESQTTDNEAVNLNKYENNKECKRISRPTSAAASGIVGTVLSKEETEIDIQETNERLNQLDICVKQEAPFVRPNSEGTVSTEVLVSKSSTGQAVRVSVISKVSGQDGLEAPPSSPERPSSRRQDGENIQEALSVLKGLLDVVNNEKIEIQRPSTGGSQSHQSSDNSEPKKNEKPRERSPQGPPNIYNESSSQNTSSEEFEVVETNSVRIRNTDPANQEFQAFNLSLAMEVPEMITREEFRTYHPFQMSRMMFSGAPTVDGWLGIGEGGEMGDSMEWRGWSGMWQEDIWQDNAMRETAIRQDDDSLYVNTSRDHIVEPDVAGGSQERPTSYENDPPPRKETKRKRGVIVCLATLFVGGISYFAGSGLSIVGCFLPGFIREAVFKMLSVPRLMGGDGTA